MDFGNILVGREGAKAGGRGSSVDGRLPARPVAELEPVARSSVPGEVISGEYVSLIIVNAVNDAQRQHGGADDTVSELAQTRARFLSDPRALMSRVEFLDAVARARVAAREPALGLKLGALLNEMSFHLVGPMLATCQTPRQGIHAFIEVRRHLLGGADWNLYPDGAEVVVGYRYQAEVGQGAQIEAEMSVATAYRVLLHAMGEEARSSITTTFGYAPPEHVAHYRQLFGERLHFGARFTGLSIPEAMLDRARPGSCSEVSDAWREFASQRLLSPAESTNFTERVRRALKSERVLAELDLERVARSWGLSLRSLRRRLESEQTTLRDLYNAERFERAQALLARRSPSISQIASSLGYFQATSFQRAFKRWSGLTPGEFRRERAPRRA